MDYSRLALAKEKHPNLFPAGLFDCFVQHDGWCKLLSGTGQCNCNPDMTITTKAGKFSVAEDGTCKKLGAAAECLPVVFDPRDGAMN